MVGVLEVRVVVKFVSSGEFQRLVFRIRQLVALIAGDVGFIVASKLPRHVVQFAGSIGVVTGVEDVELYVALIVNLMLVVVLSPELICDIELRGQAVLLHFPPCQIGACHGVTVCEHIAQFP